MENYKIYRQENYIKISGKQDWYGLVKDVFVDKSNVKKAEYRFFNVKDWKSNIANSLYINPTLPLSHCHNAV